MARPVFPYELSDPDYSWLIHNFQELNPDWRIVEDMGLPVVFIRYEEQLQATLSQVSVDPRSLIEDEKDY